MDYKYIRMKTRDKNNENSNKKSDKNSNKEGKSDGSGDEWKEFLFHLPTDPEERKNLVKDAPEALARARAALADHERACEAWNRAHPPAAADRPRAESQPGWFLNRDEIEAKLRSLGYVE
jgi:hypothetical protein